MITQERKFFAENGYQELPTVIPVGQAQAFRDRLLAMRPVDTSLFLTEEQWENSPKTHARTNPGRGYNIIEKLEAQDPACLDFVEKNETLRRELEPLLGKNFTWLKKKIVCRMPRSSLPAWLRPQLKGRLSNSLNGFIQPQFRDVAYYLEHDFHQDIIDWNRMPEEERTHRTVTLYIHLDKVAHEEDAPLVLLPGTHHFGATPYQHDVKHLPQSDGWKYDTGKEIYETQSKKIYGDTGHALIFHSCLLHATHTVKKGYRFILRYTLACAEGACGLDEINKTITGPLYLTTDYNAGERVNKDGLWNLQVSDFIRMNPA